MVHEIKQEIQAIRDDVNSIKNLKAPAQGFPQSKIDDIQSLFSSLYNNHLSSSPSASVTAPPFKSQLIYLEAYLN